jgi:hypothetical protein
MTEKTIPFKRHHRGNSHLPSYLDNHSSTTMGPQSSLKFVMLDSLTLTNTTNRPCATCCRLNSHARQPVLEQGMLYDLGHGSHSHEPSHSDWDFSISTNDQDMAFHKGEDRHWCLKLYLPLLPEKAQPISSIFEIHTFVHRQPTRHLSNPQSRHQTTHHA